MDELTQNFLLAKEGDKATFDRLQQTLRGPLTRYVRRLIGSESMVDDILQDSFVVENVRSFLYRIVRNLCYDELRRRGRWDAGSWE